MLLRNPKKPDETFETELTEDQAVEICRKLKRNSFAQSLVASYPKISIAQKYWLMKIATDNKEPEAIQLDSDLGSFLQPFRVIQFKFENLNVSDDPAYEKLRSLGKLKFYGGKEDIHVYCGEWWTGTINKDKFYPKPKCSPIVISQIKLFAIDPVLTLEIFGKATGTCCVCGRLLTDENSVERGIGPICAERYGI